MFGRKIGRERLLQSASSPIGETLGGEVLNSYRLRGHFDCSVLYLFIHTCQMWSAWRDNSAGVFGGRGTRSL